MKIFTYYQELNSAFTEQLALIRLWEASWKKQGFEPVVLGLEHARSHPYYEDYQRACQELHQQVTGHPLKKYGLACYLRWLSYAMVPSEEAFFVSDYDILNNGFPCERPSFKKLTFLDWIVPSLAYGTPSQFLGFCKTIAEATTNPQLEYNRRTFQKMLELNKSLPSNCFHDQEFLWNNWTRYPNAFDVVARESRWVKLFVDPETSKSHSLIHFAHDTIARFKSKTPEYKDIPDDQLRLKVIEKVVPR